MDSNSIKKMNDRELLLFAMDNDHFNLSRHARIGLERKVSSKSQKSIEIPGSSGHLDENSESVSEKRELFKTNILAGAKLDIFFKTSFSSSLLFFSKRKILRSFNLFFLDISNWTFIFTVGIIGFVIYFLFRIVLVQLMIVYQMS